MYIMPEIIKKSSIIGRSPSGNAVLAFENETMAAKWIQTKPDHRMTFFRQTITEEEIKITITVPA